MNPRNLRVDRVAAATAIAGLALSTVALATPTIAAAPERDPQPATYPLPGDPEGSKFEGIGVSPDERWFYVSEVTGGEIHRGRVGGSGASEWKPAGADDRGTARGITTDAKGRVYVAGGPNGIGTAPAPVDNGKPDLWVYSRTGRLLAALRTGVDNAFLNDVAIGPDGAAYFTNSNAAQIFRVAQNRKRRVEGATVGRRHRPDRHHHRLQPRRHRRQRGRGVRSSSRRATSAGCGASVSPTAR